MPTAYLFDEVLFDYNLYRVTEDGAAPLTGWPEFANTVIRNPKTGVHKTNVNRFDAIEMLSLNIKLLDEDDRAYLVNFWRGGYGSGVGFRLRVPYDFTAVDEVFGQGDGTETEFQLYKTYTRPGVTARQDVRAIVKPVIDTVARLDALGSPGGSVRLYEANGATARVIPSVAAIGLGVPGFTIKINNVATAAYVINNTTGKVTFSSAPANGAILSWSGENDIPAAFTGNSLPFTHDFTSEAQNVTFREILPVELGIVIS
jgi:hypothetical protein